MKCLFVKSEENADYGKLTFEENYKGNLEELWQRVWDNPGHKSEAASVKLIDGDDEWEETYEFKADDLDEHTFEVMSELIDYDAQKAQGWVRVK